MRNECMMTSSDKNDERWQGRWERLQEGRGGAASAQQLYCQALSKSSAERSDNSAKNARGFAPY